MAKINPTLILLLTSLLISSCLPISHSAKKKPQSTARKNDIPYIRCQVCQYLATQLHHQVKKKQSEIYPKKVSEFEIIEISENVCNLKKEESDWIPRMDIVKNGNKLELVEQDTEGQCNSQCKTIERVCQEVMGYSDTDVAEYMFKSKPQIESLVKFLCNDLTKACSVQPPPLPKDWTPAALFIPKAPKEAEMEKIMKSMEGMPGAPNMKMYSRDDLMNMQNPGKEDDEDDTDDDEDDTDDGDFSSKLGKVLRAKEAAKADWKQKVVKGVSDWKQKVIKGVSDTKKVLTKRANKVLRRIQQWWRGDKSSRKPSKGSKSEL